MLKTLNVFVLLLSAIVLSSSTSEAAEKRSQWKVDQREIAGKGLAVLWVNANIASRDLFHGPGGKKHLPRGRFTFVKEDLDGSSPKYVVTDQAGVKWKVKIGVEAKPETAASRLVWAVGYFADEDYFLPALTIGNLPQRLHRGRSAFTSDGVVRNVRLKRYLPGEEKIGNWMWSEAPFKGTRELNGLRVMMALINNWDLKDSNNVIVQTRANGHNELQYIISDLGATFGHASGTPLFWRITRSRNNPKNYANSDFLKKVKDNRVELKYGGKNRGLFKNINVDDATWIASWLSQLSDQQIRDAFRAANYTPSEINLLAGEVRQRTNELVSLRPGERIGRR